MTSATWGQSWSTSFREPFKARGQTHGNALALHGYPLRTVALVAGRGGERVMTDLRDLAHYAPELAEAFEFTANEERMPEIHVALATADELRELLSAAARREQYFLALQHASELSSAARRSLRSYLQLSSWTSFYRWRATAGFAVSVSRLCQLQIHCCSQVAPVLPQP